VIETKFKQLGKTVRDRRDELGLTQQQVADKARLNRSYICDVERGTRNVSLEAIAKIAEALELSLADLFSGFTKRRDP